ncbi:DUF6976 family protein [Ideonella livida]|uniref:Uncharacterized protein n=1 Tax=Ideonella livida TaxID=2707176 RepID=A0A7C9TP21_9BURK|nr:hypothetical protein [Ideonella livida]NDY93166.1 hypothetical protein [Ideonella livida]
MNELITPAAAAELIRAGRALALAGPESALRQLPAGNWVGGTIPYFMAAGGGTVVEDGALLFATDLTGLGEVRVASYAAHELASITAATADNGVALTILPAGSDTHRRFAQEAASYPEAFLKPTVGWIAGVHLNDLGRVTPKVFDGHDASAHEDRAVVAHIGLPPDRLADLEIVNIFEPGDGPVLRFEQTGFQVGECEIGGQRRRLSDWLAEQGLDHGRLPLVGDFAGAHVNVSFQSVDAAAGTVQLYAPVFSGVDYHVARPVPDYAQAFRERLAALSPDGLVMSCNCILNFVFGELQGKSIGGLQGPVTFGEIAYQLLNQTLVVLRVR